MQQRFMFFAKAKDKQYKLCYETIEKARQNFLRSYRNIVEPKLNDRALLNIGLDHEGRKCYTFTLEKAHKEGEPYLRDYKPQLREQIEREAINPEATYWEVFTREERELTPMLEQRAGYEITSYDISALSHYSMKKIASYSPKDRDRAELEAYEYFLTENCDMVLLEANLSYWDDETEEENITTVLTRWKHGAGEELFYCIEYGRGEAFKYEAFSSRREAEARAATIWNEMSSGEKVNNELLVFEGSLYDFELEKLKEEYPTATDTELFQTVCSQHFDTKLTRFRRRAL